MKFIKNPCIILSSKFIANIAHEAILNNNY
jgi:hypothetical protein